LLYVRTWQNPLAAENEIRSAIANIDSRLIVDGLSTLEDDIDNNILAERTIALLATTFGVLATALAGIGLYGIPPTPQPSARAKSEFAWLLARIATAWSA